VPAPSALLDNYQEANGDAKARDARDDGNMGGGYREAHGSSEFLGSGGDLPACGTKGR